MRVLFALVIASSLSYGAGDVPGYYGLGYYDVPVPANLALKISPAAAGLAFVENDLNLAHSSDRKMAAIARKMQDENPKLKEVFKQPQISYSVLFYPKPMGAPFTQAQCMLSSRDLRSLKGAHSVAAVLTKLQINQSTFKRNGADVIHVGVNADFAYRVPGWTDDQVFEATVSVACGDYKTSGLAKGHELDEFRRLLDVTGTKSFYGL